MGARQKLNESHVIGSLAIAGVLGLATGSWTVFAVTGVVLIGAAIYNNEIRYTGHSHQCRRH